MGNTWNVIIRCLFRGNSQSVADSIRSRRGCTFFCMKKCFLISVRL